MQTGKDTTIRLVVIDDHGEDAEAIVNVFRNNGIAVRPLRPLGAEELALQIESQPVDVVLAARNARGVPLQKALATVAASGKDVPVVVLADAVDAEQLAADVAAGARNVALRPHPEHLLKVVLAELDDLNARRALRRLEAQVRETERRCDALISSSRDPIAYVHEGMHIRANEAYLEMFGYESFDEIEGMSLLDMVAPQYVGQFKQLLKQLGKGETPHDFALEARTADGATFPAMLEFATATYEGEACVQVVFRRREETIDPELAREVEELRQRDPVTGLLNRPTFLRELEDAVAAAGRGDAQYGLLLVEPDHYARLLPEIGLDAADALVAAFAARLSSALDPDMRAARFGEHSLAVLSSGRHDRTAALAEKIRAAFAGYVFEVGQRTATATASIGGVQIGEKNANVGQALARASENLQGLAALGGNRVDIFDPGAVDRAEEERIQSWISLIKRAIASDGFSLNFMPVVSLKGEPGELYECLLRLESGEGETVTPANFMGIAEAHGLLADIDRWVAAHAIQLAGERLRGGHDTRLLLKISPESFADPRLLDAIDQALTRHGVPGDRLWLETPEAKVSTHLRQAQEFLAAASRLGCKVGLERFGSGLDSFQVLEHFKPAFVKLDRNLIEDLPRHDDNQRKIREIVDRAQATGVVSIAEYVQDAASMALLFGAGVDYVQGYFLAQPGPTMNYDFS
ncbi:MAG: EAL domain-containing protein [Pseudoxanthomonas sp.]